MTKGVTQVADLLREWMWSQRPPMNAKKFADWLGISPTTVWNWLNAGRKPQMNMLPVIAEKTGIPLLTLYEACGYEMPLGDPRTVWEYIIRRFECASDIPEETRETTLMHIREMRAEYETTMKESSDDAGREEGHGGATIPTSDSDRSTPAGSCLSGSTHPSR